MEQKSYIQEKDRQSFMVDLDKTEGALFWREVVSEIHEEGKEFHVWILLNDPDDRPKVFALVRPLLEARAKAAPDTEITLTFLQIIDDMMIIWAQFFEDDFRNSSYDEEEIFRPEPLKGSIFRLSKEQLKTSLFPSVREANKD